MTTRANADPEELQKFADLASRWWDPQSEFKPLHEINPLRLQWIDERAKLAGKTVLDVGCGGGILSESMAHLGADVTGIDLAEAALSVAKLHALECEVEVDYQAIAVEDLAESQPHSFDVITCLEMLEHVPDPASVVRACAALVKPGGKCFFSTINRNSKSWLFAIVGAEYVLKLLPKGTHEFKKFITPAELHGFCRGAKLDVNEMTGLSYNPLTKNYRLSTDYDVNYLLLSESRDSRSDD